MKTYIVRATLTQILELEVKAKDKEGARKKADRTDVNDWETVEDLSFEIDLIEESANDSE